MVWAVEKTESGFPEGEPVKFSDKHWERMNLAFGKTLMWEKVPSPMPVEHKELMPKEETEKIGTLNAKPKGKNKTKNKK